MVRSTVRKHAQPSLIDEHQSSAGHAKPAVADLYHVDGVVDYCTGNSEALTSEESEQYLQQSYEPALETGQQVQFAHYSETLSSDAAVNIENLLSIADCPPSSAHLQIHVWALNDVPDRLEPHPDRYTHIPEIAPDLEAHGTTDVRRSPVPLAMDVIARGDSPIPPQVVLRADEFAAQPSYTLWRPSWEFDHPLLAAYERLENWTPRDPGADMNNLANDNAAPLVTGLQHTSRARSVEVAINQSRDLGRPSSPERVPKPDLSKRKLKTEIPPTGEKLLSPRTSEQDVSGFAENTKAPRNRKPRPRKPENCPMCRESLSGIDNVDEHLKTRCHELRDKSPAYRRCYVRTLQESRKKAKEARKIAGHKRGGGVTLMDWSSEADPVGGQSQEVLMQDTAETNATAGPSNSRRHVFTADSPTDPLDDWFNQTLGSESAASIFSHQFLDSEPYAQQPLPATQSPVLWPGPYNSSALHLGPQSGPPGQQIAFRGTRRLPRSQEEEEPVHSIGEEAEELANNTRRQLSNGKASQKGKSVCRR